MAYTYWQMPTDIDYKDVQFNIKVTDPEGNSETISGFVDSNNLLSVEFRTNYGVEYTFDIIDGKDLKTGDDVSFTRNSFSTLTMLVEAVG